MKCEKGLIKKGIHLHAVCAQYGHLETAHLFMGHSPEMSATQQESLVTYVTVCNVGYQAFLTKYEFWVQNVLKSLDLVTESPRKYTVLLRYLLRKSMYLSYVLIEGYLIPW